VALVFHEYTDCCDFKSALRGKLPRGNMPHSKNKSFFLQFVQRDYSNPIGIDGRGKSNRLFTLPGRRMTSVLQQRALT